MTRKASTAADPPEAPAPTVWTAAQQQSLEAALVAHPAGKPDQTPSERWRAIGKAVDGKTTKECIARYKALAALVKAKKSAGRT